MGRGAQPGVDRQHHQKLHERLEGDSLRSGASGPMHFRSSAAVKLARDGYRIPSTMDIVPEKHTGTPASFALILGFPSDQHSW